MIIEIKRTLTPDEVGQTACGICRAVFSVEGIVAVARTDQRGEMGEAYPGCVEYLGARDPELFPSIELYREFAERYPTPMFGSEEELFEAIFSEAGPEREEELFHGSYLYYRSDVPLRGFAGLA